MYGGILLLLSTKLELFQQNALQDGEVLNRDGNLHSYGISLSALSSFLLLEGNNNLNSQIIGNGKVFVGFNSYINSGGYMRADSGGIFIGRYCSFGRRITLAPGRHQMSSLSTSPTLRGRDSRRYTQDELADIRISLNSMSPLVIESDVWIGDGAIVMPGLRIGIGAVIAANAVVTKNIEPYAIYGGVPAVRIGSRFSDNIIYKLLDSK
jgi:acetyltransferase-like isoleucine patch superfamily enzyme